MKLHHILISAFLLVNAGAFAQTTPGPETQAPRMGMGQMQKMHNMMTQRHGRHLEELKTSLKLKPEQEGLWSTFANSMKPGHSHPDKSTFADMDKLTTPERIDKMMGFKAQRDAEMQKRAEATKVFYAGLSDEQKKIFDQHTAKFMSRMEGHYHHNGPEQMMQKN